jgi:tetratricopeptide (TPR) repeat protein
MARKKVRRDPSPKPPANPGAAQAPRLQLRGWKLWSFKLAAIFLPLILILSVLEIVLRIGGFGYPTAFLLPRVTDGKKVWVQNDRFGWRFFGPDLSREPHIISIPREKPASSIRIFVFGESAAFGDPQPEFGLPRMLHTMLSLRFPETTFEVINASMTGINSHTIRDIARDCSRANGDIWVVYMGNNEVVGPFGAGTAFGKQTPSLPVIRNSLALKKFKLGQLMEATMRHLQPAPEDENEWGGMLMFLDKQVRADDPRMERVYSHFERNLSEIINAATRARAGLIVSTVAVNLRDCAPFASTNKANLSDDHRRTWFETFARGARLQAADKSRDALVEFNTAAQLDNTVAELQYRRALCAAQLGDVPAAQEAFKLARDFDTLRFRCDGKLNDITRKLAQGREIDRVLLADGEAAFETQSRIAPGQEHFYEHVHLTWEGNWLLAKTIAEQVLKLLPDSVRSRAPDSHWPSPEVCAARLGWTDVNLCNAISDIISRLQDPPFTLQLNHDSNLATLQDKLRQLAPALQPAGLMKARNVVEAAVNNSPRDPILLNNLSKLRQRTGDLHGAVDAARRSIELMPHWRDGWYHLGLVQAQAHQDDDAVASLEKAIEIDPQNVWALHNLAMAHLRMGKKDEALEEFQRVVAAKPRFGIAYLGIGQILEAQGKSQEAEAYYRKALQNRIHRSSELAMLARVCQTKNWHDIAITNFQDAIKLSPADASLYLGLAQSLTVLGRTTDAQQCLAMAAQLNPSQVQARFLLGLDLGRQGKHAEAAAHFREVIRLDPDLVEARLNLAIALTKQQLNAEALKEFEEVLRRSPTNILASQYVQALKEQGEH